MEPSRTREQTRRRTPQGHRTPQAQRKSESRARLIDAAADLFARKGFHAVSAEAVAEAAGRTTGALYSHFGGKEGLLLALLEVWKERTSEELAAEIAAGDPADPAVHFSAMWGSLTRPHPERGDSWLLLETELWLHAARGRPLVGDRLAQRYTEVRARLGEGLADWAEATGTPLTRTPEETGALVLGILLGLAMQHRLEPGAVPDGLVVEALGAVLGLGRAC
ncbi:TetR/AcrR family transcriptional regulator [Streptomyces sp. NBC_01244]|uniref:TetR/AcrR family transcriptional regulator n=1 Tax=Streptomyces sp. NBC_01244 TaxID=2903797 RepID=UPI002E13CBF4|nr:TetR/AcrR family transcriptional regulator [Streptomyces sp. NBC_01244]